MRLLQPASPREDDDANAKAILVKYICDDYDEETIICETHSECVARDTEKVMTEFIK